MPFFFFKNPLGSKMKKGIRTFCNTDGSTSTLNQHSNISTTNDENPRQSSTTLEDLVLHLELEEEIARKSKLSNHYNDGIMRGRMSCVNNSDMLRSARSALNQYPRFSLDGRDAMYRSRFGIQEGRNSVCCDRSLGRRFLLEEEEEEEDEEKYGLLRRNSSSNNNRFKKSLSLPATVAGESVVWCEPGVVAKLMGLEAMPVPVSGSSSRRCAENSRKEKVSGGINIRRQNLRRRFERHDLERRLSMEMQGYYGGGGGNTTRRNRNNEYRPRNEYCFMKPVFH